MKVNQIGTIARGQDGDIWGDFLFRFEANGLCHVYEFARADYRLGGEEPLPEIASFYLDRADVIVPHSNAVMFGREYYCEGDEFPLLYSNIYNNYAKAAEPLKGVCCVYRIWREGTAFFSQLVQILRIGFTEEALWCSPDGQTDVRPYGNFVIDRERELLYAFTMQDAANRTRYISFRLPAGREGTMDGTWQVPVVTLQASDILEQFDCPYHRFLQGACMERGRIYSLEGFTDSAENPPVLRVIGPAEKQQLAYLPFAAHGLSREPEWIAFADGVGYYADNRGNLYRLDEIMEQGVGNMCIRKIIYDTDIGTDSDDVVGLDLLISAHRQGLCELVGVTCSSLHPEGAHCARTILKYRGMSDLPLSAAPTKPADAIWYGEVVSKWYPELSCMDEPFPDSVRELRRLIAENPGVVVVVVGNFYNVGALLQSEPDDISPLSGVELVRQNVSAFALMAGSFEHQTGVEVFWETPKYMSDEEQKPWPEYNVRCDVPAAKTFFELVPVNTYLLPFEAGYNVMSGKVLVREGHGTPEALAMFAQGDCLKGRHSWDPMTALFAVWGAEPWMTCSPAGRITVDDAGVTYHTPCENGTHFFLKRALPHEAVAAKIDEEVKKVLAAGAAV